MNSLLDRINDLRYGKGRGYGESRWDAFSLYELKVFDREVVARAVRVVLDSRSAVAYKMLENDAPIEVHPRITLEVWNYICLYAHHLNTRIFAMRQVIKHEDVPIKMLVDLMVIHLEKKAYQRRIEYPFGIIGWRDTETELRDAIISHPDFRMHHCLLLVESGGGTLVHKWLNEQMGQYNQYR